MDLRNDAMASLLEEDEAHMREALREAAEAARIGEVPIGAVVVSGEGRILGRGHNLRERECDPTAHAEIIALREAGASIGDWRLEGCDLFVTVEPCPMCAGAAVNARIARIVYGVPDPKAGAAGTLFSIPDDPRLNHRVRVESGVLAEECGEILRDFFKRLRSR